MSAPVYPAILTATDWNAKKGAVAKLLPNTKLGDALRKSQEAYKAVVWEPLFHTPGVGATVSDVDEQVALCLGKLKQQLHDAKSSLDDARTLAAQIKTAWASNKLVPNDSRKHVDLLIAGLDGFKKAIDDTVAKYLAQLNQLRSKLAFANPHQDRAGNAESTGAVVRTGAKPTADVVVALKPRTPKPAGPTAPPSQK